MNKLINQKTHFPCWHAYDKAGRYVGRIEKDYCDNWYLYNAKGACLGLMRDFAEARIEARDHLHA
jgi:Flp pilus assembly protein TadD